MCFIKNGPNTRRHNKRIIHRKKIKFKIHLAHSICFYPRNLPSKFQTDSTNIGRAILRARARRAARACNKIAEIMTIFPKKSDFQWNRTINGWNINKYNAKLYNSLIYHCLNVCKVVWSSYPVFKCHSIPKFAYFWAFSVIFALYFCIAPVKTTKTAQLWLFTTFERFNFFKKFKKILKDNFKLYNIHENCFWAFWAFLEVF